MQVNQRVQALPGLICGAPYDDGWLLEIERNPGDGQSGLLSAKRMQLQSDRQLRELGEQAGRLFQRDRMVGPTMHDGGDIVQDLWSVVGTKRYHDLVRHLLV